MDPATKMTVFPRRRQWSFWIVVLLADSFSIGTEALASRKPAGLVRTVVRDVLDRSMVPLRKTVVIPDHWKYDREGKPRACRIAGATLGLATRIHLPGKLRSTRSDGRLVVVEARSNRDVLLGNLRKVSLDVQDYQSPLGLLAIDQITLGGTNLKLGVLPLLTTVGLPPLLLFCLFRPFQILVWLWRLWIYGALWKLVWRQLAPTEFGATLRTRWDSIEPTRRWLFGTGTNRLSSKVVVSNHNLEQSWLLQRVCGVLLRALLRNSVLPTVASIGDAIADGSNQAVLRESSSAPKNPLSLPGSTALMNSSSNDQQQRLSRILSATSFALRESPTFTLGNHLELPAVATIDATTKLDFVLRATLQTEPGAGLQLANPSCRWDLDLPGNPLWARFLPKIVWLPLGAGVGLGGLLSALDTVAVVPQLDRRGFPDTCCELKGTVTL